MADKVTNAEMELRVNTVYEMLLNGSSRHAICQYASASWGITQRHTDRLIAKANAIFEEQAAFVRERELGKSINRLTSLYMRNIVAKDYRGALAVQKELNTLLGLNAPAKSEHKITDWRDEIIALLKNGMVTPQEVEQELGLSLAEELFITAGVPIITE